MPHTDPRAATGAAPPPRARVDALRAADTVAVADLDALWADLDPIRAEDVLGSWRGGDFATGHPLSSLLVSSNWYGKTFASLDEVQPLVCRADDGTLFSNVELGDGEASVRNIEFRGEVTAAMIYDGRPVIDYFKKVDDTTLLGVMTGKMPGIEHEGGLYYFVLEREVISS